MKYSVVEKEATQVMGIALRTTNENWKSAEEIPPFWGRFYEEQIQTKIPHQKTGEVVGCYCDYEKDYTKPYTLIAGCEVIFVTDIPQGLVVKKIPRSNYAVFELTGKFPDQLMETWKWIWEGHLQRTYTGDFEVYPPDFHPRTNPHLTLWVAIE